MLPAGDQNQTIRMEDVVFTLNKIVDDIAKVYAGSFDDTLDDPPMDIDPQFGPEDESQWELHLPTRSNSPTGSEPPTSARSTTSSDSEDTLSLGNCSASSRFTTPSPSPTSLAFILDKDTAGSEFVSALPLAEIDSNLAAMPNAAQITTCTLLECTSGANTMGTNAPETSSSNVAPISTLEVPTIKLESSSNPKLFSWTPSLALASDSLTGSGPLSSSERGGVEIIYQTSNSSPALLSAPNAPMPGVNPPHLTMVPRLPPRPNHPRDSPPHLPALRSPTSPSTPRLDQNPEWDTGLKLEPSGFGAAYLVRQREWARRTITYASSLAEPQTLPPCRPVDKYLAWGSYSPSSANPPRKRILGAMSRRVHIGPRTLSREDWDPERKGGAIDRWNYREAIRREQTRTCGDSEQDSRRKLKPVVPLWINTSGHHEKGSGTECEKTKTEDDAPAPLPHVACTTQGDDGIKKDCVTTERNQDTMRVCVKDGKRVLYGTSVGASNSNPGSQSKSESSGSAETASTTVPLVDTDSNTMRWCVKNGVRVPSQTEGPMVDSNSKLETSASIDTSGDEGTLVTPGNSQSIAPLDQKRSNARCPYAPKKRSPLSRTLLPVSPATMRFQLRAPGDPLSVGKARRKFASMMF